MVQQPIKGYSRPIDCSLHVHLPTDTDEASLEMIYG